MSQTERSAVVTGGGNGIGRALSLELAARGYRVVVSDIAEDEAAAVVAEIEKSGREGLAVFCDVTQTADVERLVDTVAGTWSVPDLVFSNAGAGVIKPATDFTRDDLDWIFTLNVYGMVDVAARFARLAMESDRPTRIVMTGSEHSIGIPHGGNAAYTATKHAILGFAGAMREEWRELPVEVSVLCPGLTQSRFWEGQRHRARAQEVHPAARAVQDAGMPAEEAARIAVDGAEAGLFFIFTHSHAEAYARRRYEEIGEAFAYLNAHAPTRGDYDVGHVVTRLVRGQEEQSR